MSTKEAWNSVYSNDMPRIAWDDSAWTKWSIELISKHIGSEGNLLDYGCGTGKIAEHFIDKGFQVELADISDVVSQQLKNKYSIPVYTVSSPKDIQNRTNYYDYIISMGVFQHISPENWNDFLKCFHSMQKENGQCIITGWDEKDEILNKEGISRFTHQEIYGINALSDLAIKNSYKILATGTQKIKMDMYPEGRLFRYFVFQKEMN